MKNEFYDIAFRKKVYSSIDKLEADVDLWLVEYNEHSADSGRYCYGKTPMQTFLDAKHLALKDLMRACIKIACLTVQSILITRVLKQH